MASNIGVSSQQLPLASMIIMIRDIPSITQWVLKSETKCKFKDSTYFYNLQENINHLGSEMRLIGGAENRPIRKIVPKGKKENAPIFQNDKK